MNKSATGYTSVSGAGATSSTFPVSELKNAIETRFVHLTRVCVTRLLVAQMSTSVRPVVRSERVRTLSAVKQLKPSPGGVVYWMSRDQRVQDNWALLHARDLALQHGVPLSVVFCLVPHFLQVGPPVG